ncbi:MAG: response regulator [Magnetococcales bacterium]|nr:response regulator [Magnetococcales bacterium]
MENRKKIILIVDDEKINLDVVVGLLRDHYKMLVATNGEQALSRATANPPPDLILLDVMMPDMDGYEVCRRLKTNPSTQHIPVIFLTGIMELSLGLCGDESVGLTLGAVAYVHKPIDPAILLACLQTHLTID